MIGLGVEGDKAVGSAEPVDKVEEPRSGIKQSQSRSSDQGEEASIAGESDVTAVPNYGTVKAPSLDGSSASTAASPTTQAPVKMGRHLPAIPKTPRTRLQAIVRHLYRGITNLWLLDALLAIQKLLGPDTLGNPHGLPGALHKFSHSHPVAILPHLPFLSFVAPPWAVEMGIVAGLATGLSAGVSGAYHLLAAGALALGWEVESWEVDMMDSPLMGTSLLDVWGRRWHQLFRVSYGCPRVQIES